MLPAKAPTGSIIMYETQKPGACRVQHKARVLRVDHFVVESQL